MEQAYADWMEAKFKDERAREEFAAYMQQIREEVDRTQSQVRLEPSLLRIARNKAIGSDGMPDDVINLAGEVLAEAEVKMKEE